VRCVILQPSYLPWRGHFHQIWLADLFVFLDDVPYDARGWRNRNRIQTPQGPRWLTIPVRRKGSRARRTPICEIEVCEDRDWRRRHWSSIRHAYARAPFFREVAPSLERHYAKPVSRLADFTIEQTIDMARLLGIDSTCFLRASSLGLDGGKTGRLLNILREVGATEYITGTAARAYLDCDRLESAGIPIRFMRYDYPEYPQLHPPYDPRLSIVDLLFMVGAEAAPRYIWDVAGAD
jgi:hypothetical protein